MSKEVRPVCPKCKSRTMVRNGRTPSGRQRWSCKRKAEGKAVRCYTTTNPAAPYRDQASKAKAPDKNPKFRAPMADRKVFVVTWAQNATPVHQGFLSSLLQFCEHRDAQLVVIPGRYKNPTSQWTQSQENAEDWADELRPYLHNQRRKLGPNLTLAADIKTQPTAASPVTGFEGLTHGESCIIGHPKIQLQCVPTPQNKMPKIVTTTGAVTVPNYTDTRAGKLGAFHHSLAAVIVELQGTKFHLRHVTAESEGEFVDLNWHYTPTGRFPADPYQGIVFGDAHARFADPKVVAATFDDLVPRLDPATLVWHDLLDGYSVNPHHRGNPFIGVAKWRGGLTDVADEVKFTIDWLVEKTGDRYSVVVASNHDDMLARWVMSHDWRTDPENAAFYLETALTLARQATIGASGAEYPDPFRYWLSQFAPQIKALSRNESFTLGGAECGLHGDAGPNGTRGTVRNLRRLGVRVISGHGHSPAIEEGHYRAGTMTPLTLEYNRGPGNWLNSHVAVDALNKRHLINIIDGKYTTFED